MEVDEGFKIEIIEKQEDNSSDTKQEQVNNIGAVDDNNMESAQDENIHVDDESAKVQIVISEPVEDADVDENLEQLEPEIEQIPGDKNDQVEQNGDQSDNEQIDEMNSDSGQNGVMQTDSEQNVVMKTDLDQNDEIKTDLDQNDEMNTDLDQNEEMNTDLDRNGDINVKIEENDTDGVDGPNEKKELDVDEEERDEPAVDKGEGDKENVKKQEPNNNNTSGSVSFSSSMAKFGTPVPKKEKGMFRVVQTEKCAACQKTVYAMEKLEMNGHTYHKNCFKCSHCSARLTPKTFSMNEGVIYCTNHFKQLFARKGNYDEGFGRQQYKKKWQDEKSKTDESTANA